MGKDYVVSRKIAAGGMAEVLLAARSGASGFERLVVLKRILPHLREDGQFVQMFLNEARLAALLKHPNIVEIYDVERSANDFLVVMEYLSGEDLRYIIGHLRQERQPMDIGVACRIIADAAAALHFAHSAKDMDGKPMGVVHRDVAPGNILVTYDGVTKLLDFGIAKATTRATYTVPGTMKGKFAYMSPEHIQQRSLDGRSDIFSLGVVFWEVLAAQRLFKGSNDAAVLKQVMERDIPPPSQYNPNLPSDLDDVVMACLNREAGDRTPSARHLREELERLLAKMGRYVTTSQVGEWMRDTLPWRYHQRREMERAVVKEARGGGTNGSSALADSAWPVGTPMGSGPNPPPLFSASRTANVTFPGHTSHSSIMMSRSQVTGGSRLALQRPPAPRKHSAASIVALSAAATLGLALLAIFFYWMGSQGRQSILVVHAVPEGSTLSINGRVRSYSVGAGGIKISVQPTRRVRLVVSKPGRIAQTRLVVTPESGARHVYFTLPRAHPREDAALSPRQVE